MHPDVRASAMSEAARTGSMSEGIGAAEMSLFQARNSSASRSPAGSGLAGIRGSSRSAIGINYLELSLISTFRYRDVVPPTRAGETLPGEATARPWTGR
ncbi:hypothetical protein HDA45_003372 [Amycolatopsis umgeniensis]|uniref:Uncharacterized protein n=1 Tax=Amycolatopsis umgeniensis TaxID=336628 RepID=A0A841B3H4_9PSEU|nr:hypothetical protein [Amycolatopsis umgeniensis]